MISGAFCWHSGMECGKSNRSDWRSTPRNLQRTRGMDAKEVFAGAQGKSTNWKEAKVQNSEELQYVRTTKGNLWRLPTRINCGGQKRIQSKCHLRSQWERVRDIETKGKLSPVEERMDTRQQEWSWLQKTVGYIFLVVLSLKRERIKQRVIMKGKLIGWCVKSITRREESGWKRI